MGTNLNDSEISRSINNSKRILSTGADLNSADQVIAEAREIRNIENGVSPLDRYISLSEDENDEKILYIIDTYSDQYQEVQAAANRKGKEILIKGNEPWVRRLDKTQLLTAVSDGIVKKHIQPSVVLKWIKNIFPEKSGEVDAIAEAAKSNLSNSDNDTQDGAVMVNRNPQIYINAILEINKSVSNGEIRIRDDNQHEFIAFSAKAIDSIVELSRGNR